MATTPPPPTRVRTPPTPLHGAKYDSFEPFSPRRSSRLAEQRQPQPSSSPASSPISSPKRRRVSAMPREHPAAGSEDENGELFMPRSRPSKASKHLNPFASASTSISTSTMLPTPSKTPRKQRAHSPAALKSTARVLFPSRPVAVEDAMPEPGSVRKSRKFKSSFTLNGANADDSDSAASGQIPIYTDVKEREPQRDDADDNPFVGPRKTRSSRKGGLFGESARKKVESNDDIKEMEEAVARNEGLIYVFRGKKVFRRFDTPPAATEESPQPEDSVRRQIGAAATKPFTRSSMKPRLLWPSKDQPQLQNGEDTDPEEAPTDIEINEPIHEQTPRKRRHVHPTLNQELLDDDTMLPQASASLSMSALATPPPSSTKRRKTRNIEVLSQPDTIYEDEPTSTPSSVSASFPQFDGRKKASPFASWRRVKSGASTASSGKAKRAGSPIERDEGKRMRSAN